MSFSSSTPAPVAKTPFLAAAALFLAVAAFVFALAIKPLGAAELLGLLACVAASSAFATIPFAIDFARRLDATRAPAAIPLAAPAPAAPAAPALDADRLAEQIGAQIEAHLATALPALAARIGADLAAAEESRRAELHTSLAAATPTRPVDSDTVNAPAGAKPRLGRGLLGLMHAPSALAAKPAAGSPGNAEPQLGTPSPVSDDDRAAA